MPHRLFIAIRPPEPVRDLLVDAMEALDDARWVGDEQLHLTLRFVGPVERPAANDLADALGSIDWPDFMLEIDGVAHFARRGRPSALYAQVRGGAELEGLRQKVERACERVGLGLETRRFTPHITLARLGGQAPQLGRWLPLHGGLRTDPWPATTFTLFESHLSPQGAHYQAIADYPLHG